MVEDSRDQAELIITAFQDRDPTLRITAAEDGFSCLEMLSHGRFNVLLLDYSLPKMNGLEVLRRIRKQGHTVPVIMVTGQGDERIAVEAMKLGASDYVIKTPDYLEALLMVVLKVIEKYRLEKCLEQSSLRTRQLYEVSLSVAKERKIDALAKTLVEKAKQLMTTEGAFFFLNNPESGEVTFSTCSGIEFPQDDLPKDLAASFSLFGLAYAQRQPVIVEAPAQHPLWEETPVTLRSSLRHFLSVPLVHKEKVEGVLGVLNKDDEEPFTQEDVNCLSILAVHVAVAIDNARFLDEMESRALSDSLTGLYNHREFQNRLMEEVERSSRYSKEFSLLMIDMDFFKTINDTHGHPVGDEILKGVVQTIKKCIRKVDIAARYGGEEFTVILPEADRKKSEIVAERIRKTIAENSFITVTGYPVKLSVSIGIASFPSDATKREELILASDQALYLAKEGGRNKTCHYSDSLKSAIEKDKEKLNALLLNPEMRIMKDLASTIDAKSPYTRGHTEEVTQYASRLGEALNLTEAEKKSLQLASLLRNIGMVNIPDALLNKPGPLTDEEKKVIQSHPALAKMLIKGLSHLDSVLPAILFHHERYDGQGYPNGLVGEKIPFLARILGVVEAYHAMISIRPYRPKMGHQEAVEQLRRNAGSQFDPRVVKTFINILNKQ